MKTFNHFRFPAFLLVFCLSIASCEKDDADVLPDDTIVGSIGNPQFNLKFTNHERVDLDLYVKTPDGAVLYYGNPLSQGGQLDVDCQCTQCPNGPNENIYWEEGTAPSGHYEFWVEYYGSCDGTWEPARYTLRVIQNGRVSNTYTGTLTSDNPKSTVYSFRN